MQSNVIDYLRNNEIDTDSIPSIRVKIGHQNFICSAVWATGEEYPGGVQYVRLRYIGDIVSIDDKKYNEIDLFKFPYLTQEEDKKIIHINCENLEKLRLAEEVVSILRKYFDETNNLIPLIGNDAMEAVIDRTGIRTMT